MTMCKIAMLIVSNFFGTYHYNIIKLIRYNKTFDSSFLNSNIVMYV